MNDDDFLYDDEPKQRKPFDGFIWMGLIFPFALTAVGWQTGDPVGYVMAAVSWVISAFRFRGGERAFAVMCLLLMAFAFASKDPAAHAAIKRAMAQW